MTNKRKRSSPKKKIPTVYKTDDIDGKGWRWDGEAGQWVPRSYVWNKKAYKTAPRLAMLNVVQFDEVACELNFDRL